MRRSHALCALAALLHTVSARADIAVDGPTPNPIRDEVQKTVAAWVEAQNRGDAAAYLAHYDQAHFKGVKRTARGGVKTFDYPGWAADRTAMLARHPRVEVVSPRVELWLDRGSDLRSGVSRVRFEQRWKSERYADHGQKILLLWREAPGRHRIIYEDLLGSLPGWDEKSRPLAEVLLKAPRSDEQALSTWEKIKPTGANYAERLASIPKGDTRRVLARSLLGAGDFTCLEIDVKDECGEEYSSWKDLNEKAGLDDPCLRRRLAHWALTEGGLTEADVRQIKGELTGLLGLEEPEVELPGDVMDLVDGMSPALRMEFLAAAPRELANEHTKGLPQAALIDAQKELHLDSAALAVDYATHRAAVLAALSDEELAVETRDRLMDRATGRATAGATGTQGKERDVNRALADVADHAEDCGLSMRAALELEERGDPSHLPRRPKEETAQAFGRELCRLVHEPDHARQLARYKEFLPRSRRVLITEQLDDHFAERDHDGNRIDASPRPRYFTRKGVDSFNIAEEFGRERLQCGVSDCKVQFSYSDHFDVLFGLIDGHLYITELHRYRWEGCPC